MNKNLLMIFGVMGAVGLGRVQAQLLEVNFIDDSVNVAYGGGNVPAPAAMSGAAVIGSPGDLWNGLGGFAYSAYPNGATFTSGTLLYANGSASGITLSLSAPSGTYDANAAGFNNHSLFSWASLADEQNDIGYPYTPWAGLMASCLAANSTAATGFVTLRGLAPGGVYNLYTYNASDQNEGAGRTSTFTVNGVTQTSTYSYQTNLVKGADYLEFTNVVADSTGTLTINFGDLIDSESDFNGFQLQAVTNHNGGTEPPATQWNIVWSDEFNGTSINTNNWTFEIGGDCPNNCGWGNSELEYYTSRTNNAYVDGKGLLHIVAQQDSTLTNGYSYTSARMKTEGLYHTPTYGRFEWRAALPAGVGMWPALWMLGSDFPSANWPACGEIDVVENNGATPTWVQGSLHYGTSGEVSDTAIYNFPSGGSTTNFHTYLLDWETNSIQWFVDGQLYETQSVGAPFNAPFFFIMNLAVGGDYLNVNGTNPTPAQINAGAVFPAQMLVDYVRVYEPTAPLAISAATQPNRSVELSWPTNIVCHLQIQTNALAGTNWVDTSVTTSPFVVLPYPKNTSVFYRLASP